MVRSRQKNPATSALRDAFALHQAGDLKEAARRYRRILKKDKKNVEALYLLGSLYLQDGDLERAESVLSAALKEKPAHKEALYNLARALMDLDRCNEAEELLLKVLNMETGNVSALRNLGVVYLRLGRPQQAAKSLHKAVALDPLSAETWCDLGLARSQNGNDNAAEVAFNEALSLDPSLARARHNRGHLRLRNSNFTDGWVDYESRMADAKSGFESRPFSQPTWQGESLTGKRLLVWGEQGLGDQVLHAGMLEKVVQIASHVTVECEPRLVGLFERSFPSVTVVGATSPPHPETANEALSFQIPSASLGRWCGPGSSVGSPSTSYLVSDPALARRLRAKYRESFGDRPLIGISWRSYRVGTGLHKSTDLVQHWHSMFAALPSAVFVSLQYGPPNEIAQDIAAARKVFPDTTFFQDTDLDPNTDIESVAAQISSLDRVVSVSNTTVHLAGALGIPVWTLVPLGPARLWYWFDRQETTPWYPTMRLAWQREVGRWQKPMEVVGEALKKWAAERE